MEFYKQTGFWKKSTQYKPGEPLTNEKLIKVEEHLGRQLPASYVTLMKAQNGGELKHRYVLFEDGEAAIIPYFYEVDLDHGIGLTPVFIEECGLPEGLVLLTGDLHSWLALDYRKSKDPSVVYISEDESESGLWEEYPLALTFSEFTARLFRKEG